VLAHNHWIYIEDIKYNKYQKCLYYMGKDSKGESWTIFKEYIKEIKLWVNY